MIIIISVNFTTHKFLKVNAYGVDSILMMIRDLNIRQLRILIEHARHAATIQLYMLPEMRLLLLFDYLSTPKKILYYLTIKTKNSLKIPSSLN